jgi:DNA polymerase-3 subunit beta
MSIVLDARAIKGYCWGMKFSIAREAFTELVGRVQNILPPLHRAAAVPVFSHLLLEASDGQLAVTATDLVMGMRYVVPAKVTEPGVAALPGRRLFHLLRELTSGHVHVNITGTGAEIQADGSRFRLNIMDGALYPKLPDLTGARHVRVNQKHLKELLYRTLFAVAREESGSHSILTGLLLRLKDGALTAVGTDGKRLAKTSCPVTAEGTVGDIVIPSKAAEEMAKALNAADEEATLHFMQDRIALEADGGTVVTKLLSESYPDVDRVIPKKATHTVVLHRQELITLLRQVSLFTTEAHGSVKLSFAPGELTLNANSSEVGEGRVSMPVDYQATPFEIAFNPVYLLDILRHTGDETVLLKLIDSFNPGVFNDTSASTYVVMPMRLSK